MRKFKSVFYPIYILTIVLVVIMSFNIYESLELLREWGWFKYFSDLPFIGRNLLLFLCGLMAIELAVENVAIFTWRRSRKAVSGLAKNEKI